MSKHPNMDGWRALCRIGILLEFVAPNAFGPFFVTFHLEYESISEFVSEYRNTPELYNFVINISSN